MYHCMQPMAGMIPAQSFRLSPQLFATSATIPDLSLNQDMSPAEQMRANDREEYDCTTDTNEIETRLIEPSQIPGAQQSCILDNELSSLNRQEYMDTLLRITKGSEIDLNTYRDILWRRANTCADPPNGRLINRRGSRKNPAIIRIAQDCYIINMFIHGDKSEIDSICSKTRYLDIPDQTVVTDHNAIENPDRFNYNVEFSKLLANMIELGNKFSELQMDRQTDRDNITRLNREIQTIKAHNKELKGEVVALNIEMKEIVKAYTISPAHSKTAGKHELAKKVNECVNVDNAIIDLVERSTGAEESNPNAENIVNTTPQANNGDLINDTDSDNGFSPTYA